MDRIQGYTNVLAQPVLVLMSTFQPFKIVSTRYAIEVLCRGTAKVIGDEEIVVGGELIVSLYQPFTFEQWIEVSRSMNGTTDYVHSAHFRFRRPTVVQFPHFYPTLKRIVPLTHRNVHIRDNYLCQYCGCKVDNRNLSIDHVIPIAKGGQNTWENLVTACKRCNNKKDSRLLSETSMLLKRKPKRLTWQALAFHRFDMTTTKYPTWKPFFG